MASVKLTYFNLRARGEPCRLLLAYGGVKYEDERITPSFEDPAPWAARKSEFPYGQLPVLSWNGMVISQSMACARFIAKEIGVAGRTNLERAQVDEVIDAIQDLIEKRINLFKARDTEGLKKHMTETNATAYGQFEKRMESRGGQFMVGNSFSWADLHLYGYVSEFPDKTILDGFPKIKSLIERVGKLPNIKAWVESRPIQVTNI